MKFSTLSLAFAVGLASSVAAQTAADSLLCAKVTVLTNTECACVLNDGSGAAAPATILDLSSVVTQTCPSIAYSGGLISVVAALLNIVIAPLCQVTTGLLPIAGTLQQVIDNLGLGGLINAAGGTACQYPANADPTCSGCDYDCIAGYTKCSDGSCQITCPSGLKRRASRRDFKCGPGFKTCSTPPAIAGGLPGWECLDVSSNMESCGGCPNPRGNEVAGADCSAIDGVADVSCVYGSCVVNSCMKGFRVSNNGTACEPNAMYIGGSMAANYWASQLRNLEK